MAFTDSRALNPLVRDVDRASELLGFVSEMRRLVEAKEDLEHQLRFGMRPHIVLCEDENLLRLAIHQVDDQIRRLKERIAAL